MPNDINEMKKFVNNVKKLVEKKVNNAKTDTSKKAIVQSLNEDGTANIIINGEVYNNVKIRAGLQPQINEVVLVSIPNNNTKDMFIDLTSSTSTSGGGTDHTHSNLSILETITQALIDAWNSAVSHISDAIRHITSNERDLWNTVSNKIDNTEVVTTATPNKILKLDSNSKLPASITGNADGNASTATKLQTARTINLSGDVIGSANFDGSGNISINATVVNDSHNHTSINYKDTRSINHNGFNYKGVSMHLKYNTTDGLSDGGRCHGVLHLTQWSDISGGKSHQLGFTDNGNIWYRNWDGSAWSSWVKIAKMTDIPIPVGTTAPSNPFVGSLWIDTNG